MNALTRDIREDILPDYIKKLTTIANNLNTRYATAEDEGECSICLEPIKKDNIIVELECGHIFHKHCIITNIFNNNNKCPLCRKQFFEIPAIDTSTINYINNDNNGGALDAITALLSMTNSDNNNNNPSNNSYFNSLF